MRVSIVWKFNFLDMSNMSLHNYGASLIKEGCHRLSEGEKGGEGGGIPYQPSVTNTACQIFHTFFTKVPFTQFDILLTAATSCLLASKTHDSASFIRSVVIVFDRIQQDRQHSSWNTPMYLLGSRHQTWCSALKQMEAIMLKELAFHLYPFLEHPHRFVPFIATSLTLDSTKDKPLLQDVWNFLNDCFHTTICIEFPPQVVTVAAFVRAAATHQKRLPIEFAANYGASDYSLVLQAMEIFYTQTLPNTPIYLDSLAPEGWQVPLLPPKLTNNAISTIHQNPKDKTAVTLQIVSLKSLPKDRFKCNLSDGTSFMNAVFTKKMKDDHNLMDHSIINVMEKGLKDIGGRKVLVILKCSLLAQTTSKIKNPTRYDPIAEEKKDNLMKAKTTNANNGNTNGKKSRFSSNVFQPRSVAGKRKRK